MKEIDDNGTIKTIEYAYSGAEVIQEFAEGTGVENKTFVYGPGIDNPIYMDAASSGTSYFGTNSIGSITALSDSSGNLLESYEYRPFGEETVKNASGTVISGTAYANPYMFTARRKDYEEGSNLYHFRTRQYSAITGRFISHDSIGDWGNPSSKGNGMAYCHNDPINWRDPYGLYDYQEFWKEVRKIKGSKRAMDKAARIGIIYGGPFDDWGPDWFNTKTTKCNDGQNTLVWVHDDLNAEEAAKAYIRRLKDIVDSGEGFKELLKQHVKETTKAQSSAKTSGWEGAKSDAIEVGKQGVEANATLGPLKVGASAAAGKGAILGSGKVKAGLSAARKTTSRTLSGHNEYTVANKALARKVRAGLEKYWRANCNNSRIQYVDNIHGAQIDTITGVIRVSSDVRDNYPHLLDGYIWRSCSIFTS